MTSKTFSNSSIEPRIPNKPHIVKIGGWWRVSNYSKSINGSMRMFAETRTFVVRLNIKELHNEK